MKRGFTLIELLITVAIIAILAAIAIPNFLSAQTRSKVSRVKADMRTLATGLESYFVDNNRYPPDAQTGDLTYLRRLVRLTTPIAYLSSVPADPFANKGRIREYVQTKDVNPYTNPPDVNSEAWVYPLTYDYATRQGVGGALEPADGWVNISRQPEQVIWAIRSAAPDQWPVWLGDETATYDPTNGTISDGNIFWSGPGIGEDGPID